jgi:SagB-type dehydrogenase family enzyme
VTIFVRHGALDPPGEALSELFHENTKLRSALGAVQAGIPGDYSTSELEAMARAFKRYRLFPQVPLPAAETLPRLAEPLDDLLERRRTTRTLGGGALTLAELSKLLHLTTGITGGVPIPGSEWRQEFRTAPSAGALYPTELYLGVREVDGLEQGIYHYEVEPHALALLRPGDPTQALLDVCCYQPQAAEAAVVVLIGSVLARTRRKYGERGYRYALLDAGHLAQNLYLAAVALELGAMTTGGFFDDAANELLRLDGVDDAVIYVAFVGRPEGDSRPDASSGGD